MTHPKSLSVTVLLTFLVALGPISTDLYLPSLPSIARDFGSSTAQVQLTLSVFLAGFAAAQLIYGPLSDRFGRRTALLIGLLTYIAATLLCTFADSIEALILGRFLQALGGCVGPVVGRAVVRDVYGREEAARVLSYMALAMALAPALGPILGGYLEVWLGWRANFAALLCIAVIGLTGTLIVLPETNRWLDETATRPKRIAANFAALLRDPGYLGYLLLVATSYSGIFAFISGSSFVLIDTLGLTPDLYGLSFAAFVAGYMVGTFLSGRLSRRLGLDRLIQIGCLFACLGGTAAVALAVAGVLSVGAILWPLFVFMIGTGLILPNAFAGAIDPYPKMAGAASALLGFCQMVIAACVGIAVGQSADGTALPMTLAIALAAFCGLAALYGLVRKQAAPTPEGSD